MAPKKTLKRRRINKALVRQKEKKAKESIAAYMAVMPPPEDVAAAVMLTRQASSLLKDEQWRVPKGVPLAAAMLAGEARNTLVEAMLGTIPAREAKTRIQAAIEIRDEVCGRIPTKIDLNAEMSFAALVGAASAKLADRDPQKLPSPIPASDQEIELAPNQETAEA
jgi:hypothetical protein